MRRFQTEDGYLFYEQEDGTLTDTADPADTDLVYANLAELKEYLEVIEETDA